MKRTILGLAGGTGLMLVAGAGFLWISLRSADGARFVDFDAVAEAELSAVEDRSALRVVIASMLTPSMARVYYEDLFRLVAARAGRRVRFIVRKTYAEVNQSLRDGEIDLAFVCSGPYVTGKRDFGMELLAVPSVRGKTEYRSYVIVPEDSPARTLNDLKGKRFAYTDPHSSTGFLSPRHALLRAGLGPDSFFAAVVFTYGHDKAIEAVAAKRVDGAAVDSLVYDFLAEVAPAKVARTRVLRRSEPYGIQPVVASPKLGEAFKEELRSIFMELHKDEAGAAVLRKMRIDAFKRGDDRSYESVRAMRRELLGTGS